MIGLPAANFFDWDACRTSLPLTWKAIGSFTWPAPPQGNPPAQTPKTIPSTPPITPPDAFLLQFLAALNSHNAAQVTALYDPGAIQVWADQILRDVVSIRAGFAAFFNSLPAGTVFTVSQDQVGDDSRLFVWKAGPFTGNTTLILKNEKITLDYTFIS